MQALVSPTDQGSLRAAAVSPPSTLDPCRQVLYLPPRTWRGVGGVVLAPRPGPMPLSSESSRGQEGSPPSALGALEGQGCASPTNPGLPDGWADLLSDLLSDQGLLVQALCTPSQSGVPVGRNRVSSIRLETPEVVAYAFSIRLGAPQGRPGVSHSDWMLPE